MCTGVCTQVGCLCACVCVCALKNQRLADGNIIEVGVAVFVCFFSICSGNNQNDDQGKIVKLFRVYLFWSNRVALIGEVRNSFARREKKRGRRKLQLNKKVQGRQSGDQTTMM